MPDQDFLSAGTGNDEGGIRRSFHIADQDQGYDRSNHYDCRNDNVQHIFHDVSPFFPCFSSYGQAACTDCRMSDPAAWSSADTPFCIFPAEEKRLHSGMRFYNDCYSETVLIRPVRTPGMTEKAGHVSTLVFSGLLSDFRRSMSDSD
jgi:hypothetical protein